MAVGAGLGVGLGDGVAVTVGAVVGVGVAVGAAVTTAVGAGASVVGEGAAASTIGVGVAGSGGGSSSPQAAATSMTAIPTASRAIGTFRRALPVIPNECEESRALILAAGVVDPRFLAALGVTESSVVRAACSVGSPGSSRSGCAEPGPPRRCVKPFTHPNAMARAYPQPDRSWCDQSGKVGVRVTPGADAVPDALASLFRHSERREESKGVVHFRRPSDSSSCWIDRLGDSGGRGRRGLPLCVAPGHDAAVRAIAARSTYTDMEMRIRPLDAFQ